MNEEPHHKGSGPKGRRQPIPGEEADRPGEIPRSGWKQILTRVKGEISKDHVSIVAAGAAFYLFLAIIPLAIAGLSIYGLVTEPREMESQMEGFYGLLPGDAQNLVRSQLHSITSRASSTLGWTTAISILVALWSASSGMASLITAINMAYDEKETRGFIRFRSTALAMTLGFLVFAGITLTLIGVAPVILNFVGLGETGRILIDWGRWPLLGLFMIGWLAVLYRYSPNRDQPRWKWVSWGSIAATLLWIAGSVGFSLYVENFGSYASTYGSLAGVVVLQLWLLLTTFAILLGAELNSEIELQTARDSTRGAEAPMGQRGATKADQVPEDTSERRASA